MFPEKGFSFTQKGANSGILVPIPAISNMFSNEKYAQTLNLIKNIDDLSLIKEELSQKAFQGFNIDADKMFYNFMLHSIFNNLTKLNQQDINANSCVLSNSNTIFSLYPVKMEYPDAEQSKVEKFPLEFKILEFIHNYCDQKINLIILKELFLELLIVIKDKKRGHQTLNININKISELKHQLLNNEDLNKLYEEFTDNEIFINVNKQGSDGKNNIYYNVPVYLSEKAKKQRDSVKIEKFSINLPAILETGIPAIHPVFLKKIDKLILLNIHDGFKIIYWYKTILKNFLDLKENNVYEFILQNMVKIEEKSNKIQITIKNIEKEIIMNTVWYEVGKQFSNGVFQMHKGKGGKDLYKAISSTKEELVNTISMKKPELRSDILITKYLVKFGITIESSEPDKLLLMDDSGLKEFILGLYIKTSKEEI